MKTKMKQLFGILLSLSLVLGLMPGMSLTAYASAPDVASVTTSNGTTTYYSTLAAAVSAATTGSTVTLLEDVTTASTINVSETKTLTLDLNNHVLTGNIDSGSVIEIRSNSTLNLVDNATSKTTHYYTPQSSGPAKISDTETAYGFTGGYITGSASGTANNDFNQGYHVGGGVYVANGCTFNMNGGSIFGINHNGENPEGAGVYVCGTFNMNGGKIVGNSNGNNGGGVGTSANSTVTINGGTISHNKTGWGGGITVRGTFSMSSGTISGNTATGGGGGIHVDNAGGGSPSVTLTGGSITGNTSGDRGGGIHCYTVNTFKISGSPEISGNKRGTIVENVYLPNGKLITVDGELTSGASVGVTMQTADVFTNSNPTTYNDASKFKSDSTSYTVGKNADGQLYLGTAYSVTYDGNGGTGTMTDPNSPYLSGSTVTVLKNGFTAPANHTFAGFKIGDGATIYANASDNISGATTTFTITDNTTLTAQWKEMPEVNYDINIGGVPITSKRTSGDGWKYDPSTNTLTLSNFSFNGIGDAGGSDPSGIVNWQGQSDAHPKHDPEDFHIALEGNNTIVEQHQDGHSCVWGIISYPNFTISGNGTLNVSTVDGELRGAAIYAYQNLDITGGTIIATSGSVTGNAQGYGIGGGVDSVLTIGENAKVTTAGPKGGISVTVKNSTPGIGWTNTTGTGGKALIESKPSGQNLISYKKVQFPAKVANITFKVENGAWNNDTKEDQSVTLFGREDETLKLAADQIPAVGEKPDAAYKAGTWDVTPNTETEITKDITYTYTYDAEEAAVVKEAPKAKEDLTYTGTEQELVTAGTAEGGEILYAIGTDANTAPTTGWSANVPKGTDAGTYYVWYYVKGDGTHTDSKPVCITVKIAGAVYTATDKEYTITSGEDTPVTVKREPDDNKTYDLYTGAQMDGKALPEGSHTTAKGSLVLTLKAAYLDTLTVGDHKLTIAFEDGSATATIKIKEAAPAPTATPKPVPRTGDSNNIALWLTLIAIGLVFICGTVMLRNLIKNSDGKK